MLKMENVGYEPYFHEASFSTDYKHNSQNKESLSV